ncbi:hypothetical protein ACLB2K_035496 [Fragaria x ananassa]
MARQKLTTRMTGIPRYPHGASPLVIEIIHSSPSHGASPSRSSSSDADSSSFSLSRSYSKRGTSSKRARLSPTPSHKGKGKGKAIPVSASSSPSRSYFERGTSSKRARLSPTPSHKGKSKAISDSSSSSPSHEKPSESLDSFVRQTHEGIPGYVHRPLSPPPSHPMTMMDAIVALEDVLAQIHMLTSSVNAIKRNIEDRINKAARK